MKKQKLAFIGLIRYPTYSYEWSNNSANYYYYRSIGTQHSAKQKYIHCEEGKKRRDPPVVFETAHEEVFLRVDFDNFLQNKTIC